MKLTSTLVSILAGAALALAQDAGQPASRLSADSIQQQIKNLDNDSYDVRNKAMDSLRAAGEDARKDLEAARTSQSLEVRTRAETLLKELDARKAGVSPPTGLRPLSPEEELPAAGQQRGRNVAPRFEDFQEPKAFVEALRKWIEESNKGRFPDFVLPPDMSRDFGQDFTIIEPDVWSGGGGAQGSMMITSHKDGETITYKSGADGVTLNVQKKNEAGETVIESYQAKDAEELKKNHPDIWEKYQPLGVGGVTSIFRSGAGRTIQGRRGLPAVPAPPAIQTLTSPRLLGVVTAAVPPVLDSQLKLKGEGVVIESVSPGSVAERFGIQAHDVLIKLDVETIRSTGDIIRVMSAKETPPASAKVVREGAVLDLTLTR